MHSHVCSLFLGDAPMQRLPLTLPLDNEEECLRTALQIAVQHCRPEWHGKQLLHEIFKDGITNKIFSVYASDDDKDRIVFRLYGRNTDKIIDRAAELEHWAHLNSKGLAARLYAAFENGIICGFQPGLPFSTSMLRDPPIQRRVCAAVASMHDLHNSAKANSETQPVFQAKLQTFLDNLNPQFEYEIADKRQHYCQHFDNIDLREEVRKMEEEIANTRSPLAFCHNDLLIYNILYDSATDKVSFIDYEYCGVNYELFDIGNHFNEWSGVVDPDFSLCPSEEERRVWLECYFNSRSATTERVNERVERSMQHILLFEAASHLFWSVWSLVQSQNSTIDFDYLSYATSRFGEYRRKMEEYLKKE